MITEKFEPYKNIDYIVGYMENGVFWGSSACEGDIEKAYNILKTTKQDKDDNREYFILKVTTSKKYRPIKVKRN